MSVAAASYLYVTPPPSFVEGLDHPPELRRSAPSRPTYYAEPGRPRPTPHHERNGEMKRLPRLLLVAAVASALAAPQSALAARGSAPSPDNAATALDSTEHNARQTKIIWGP